MGTITVVRITNILPHPNADKLELLWLSNDIRVVTGLHYHEEQLGLYISPGLKIPGWLAEEMWLMGRATAMTTWFEVREITLRGVVSPGLFAGQIYQKDKSDPRSIARFEKLRAEGGRANDSDDVIRWPFWRDWWKEGDDLTAYIGAVPFDLAELRYTPMPVNPDLIQEERRGVQLIPGQKREPKGGI